MASGDTASGETASGVTASAPRLARAISAALVDEGVPFGSIVDVTSGPAEGLGFVVGDDGEDG